MLNCRKLFPFICRTNGYTASESFVSSHGESFLTAKLQNPSSLSSSSSNNVSGVSYDLDETHTETFSLHSKKESTFSDIDMPEKQNSSFESPDSSDRTPETVIKTTEPAALSIPKGSTLSSDKEDSVATDIPKTTQCQDVNSQPPEAPAYCCGTGCPNCSWIIYAEELKRYYGNNFNLLDKKEITLKLDQIQDPSVRRFVKIELSL
ncbi:Oxidoreductase-like domain-containing protein 1 [Biomphalaria pfeifferi]|uniref:Oxidoreductase-like domain-containing protein 1 n=1 Tax=Biomphalaria pfeifferi TaxID=112525 RepID=A0AAD8BLA5_BIOPF|nr:Oxidoreductase-like domain-containing protein 1 [Biomphalaria pfeifferi]